jgi:4-hydroxybenzoate polyprenyl transferase
MTPYIQLLRLDKPVGTLLLLWPCWWGLALSTQDPPVIGGLYGYGLFALGALLLRSAGCIINDLWDKKIDQQVARTKNRPLTNGTVTIPQALAVLVLLLLAGLLVLVQLPLPSIMLGFAVMPLVVLYPLAKRFFPLPQLVLGLVFAWGALLAPFTNYDPDTMCVTDTVVTCTFHVVPLPLLGQLPSFTLWLYAACVLWTLGYDTLYALQDIKDDTRLNLRSSARTFGRWVKPMVVLCYSGMAVFLVLAYLASGRSGDMAFVGCLSLVLLIISYLVWVVLPLNKDNATACGLAFRANGWLGLALFIMIAVG